MLSLRNTSDTEVVEFVNGRMIRVPAKGSATVTERQWQELQKAKRPGLTINQMEPYADLEIFALDALSREQLLAVAKDLMRGLRVTLPPVAAGPFVTPSLAQDEQPPVSKKVK